jgi:hypothetical protein
VAIEWEDVDDEFEGETTIPDAAIGSRREHFNSLQRSKRNTVPIFPLYDTITETARAKLTQQGTTTTTKRRSRALRSFSSTCTLAPFVLPTAMVLL